MPKRKEKGDGIPVQPTGDYFDEAGGNRCGHLPTLEDYGLRTDRDAWKSLIQQPDAWEALRYRMAVKR
jgi:hypothetical protein